MIKKNEKQKRYFQDILKLGGTGKKNRFFLGKTFSTKFFLKFCSDMIDPECVCFQILKYEPENRTKEDIKKASPWLKTLKVFYDFISLKESEETCNTLIDALTWVLFRNEFTKNKIIKRAGEKNNFFYLILNGNLQKLDLVIYRKVLSLEEYLLYLIKMKIVKENGIFNKCKMLNKTYVNIDEDSIKKFCEKNKITNYEKMKKNAINELNELGLNIPEEYDEDEINNNEINLKSIDNYLNIFLIQATTKRQRDPQKAYFNFYLSRYEKNGILKTGFFFGNVLKKEIEDDSTYISKTQSNIGIYNKEENYIEELFENIINKNKKIFKELNNQFFIFHHIKEDTLCNNYAPFMVYKRYFKGDKIFLQNSFYEGIYLIKSGEVKISTNISIDEMYNLITYLTFALNGYNDYVSGFTSKDYINEQIKQQNLRIKSHDGLDNEIVKLYIEAKNYPLMIIKEYNILGTNESFDHQTEIYNFSAECISDEAILYFLPKEILNKILKKEKMVYSSLIQLVEFRIKNIIWKVKNYINIFENKMVKLKAKKMKTKKNILLNIENDNNDYKTNNVNITENNSIKNIVNGIQKKMIKSHNYSKSNIIENIKYKNLFLSHENKNINFNDMIYSYRKTTNNNIMQSILFTPKIPKVINSVKKSRKNECNYTLKQFPTSQSKKNLRNCMNEKFPYLVMDIFSKREILNDRKKNFFYQIKTSNNIKTFRKKSIYVNNNYK